MNFECVNISVIYEFGQFAQFYFQIGNAGI